MDMNSETTRTPRRVKIVLAVSLALNVLVLGAVAGSAFHDGGRDRRNYSDRSNDNAAIGIYGRALAREDRRAVGQRLRADRGSEGREIRAELGDLAGETAQLLRAMPFDKDAFAAVLLRQQALIKGRSDNMQAALVDHIASMTPEARIEYADRLQEILERTPKKNRSDKK
ncbi:periplasmic heavy metal sensor [Litoreibacter janthinus]|uniref:Uncharacterized membrane protein n=1 Tax=Litoreibacter janthinus TaxID=670154 RepID=A0A1I6HSU4_9RHOB|nr:periplasmic heavy metal sensor [Litoreibacter janthinus]SFR57468.1 Uncharacterized membrane protein [Litoreibacter janthinus]